MSDKQETIADIIAEKWRIADEIERDCAEKMKRGEMVSDRYARELVTEIRREADRLEAAWKRDTLQLRREIEHLKDERNKAPVRERERLRKNGFVIVPQELLTKPAENVNSASASDTAGNSGNAAKLREALERVLCWLKRMNAEPLDTLAVSEFTPSYAVNRTAKSIIEDNDYHISQITAALSAPPRNCDRFASAEEAWDAYDEWVESYRSKGKTEPFNEFGWLFAHATEKEGGAE